MPATMLQAIFPALDIRLDDDFVLAVLFKGPADSFFIFTLCVDDINADAGAAGTGLDHQREIVA